jgi:hypothetical protein
VKIGHKKAQAAISLFVMCMLFLAPVALRPCETTEAPEHTCCCCACCQESEPPPAENHSHRDECSCRMAERHDQESSPAVLVSASDNRPEMSPLTFEVRQAFEGDPNRPLDFDSRNPTLPSRDQPLYILNSSFLI